MCFRQFWDVVTGVIMGTDVATDVLQILEFSQADGERARFLFYVSLGIYISNAIIWTFIYLCIIYFWRSWAEGKSGKKKMPISQYERNLKKDYVLF